MNIDLHSHTTASDGTFSPNELLQLAKNANIDTLAITDHDTIAGFLAGRALADTLGIRLISGVEISTQHTIVGGYGINQALHKNIHIVGLNFHNFEKMQTALNAAQDERAGRGRAIVKKMGQILADNPKLMTHYLGNVLADGAVGGIDNDLGDDANKASFAQITDQLWTATLAKTDGNPKAVGRPHIAQVLCEWGVVTSVSQAFDKYLGDDKGVYVPLKTLSMAQAITLIHDCGGIAVLAHPTRYGLSATRVRRLIGEFAECGGDACELPNPSEPISTRKMIDREIAKNGLLVSVGSDFHGTITPWRKLGQTATIGAEQVGVWGRFDGRA